MLGAIEVNSLQIWEAGMVMITSVPSTSTPLREVSYQPIGRHLIAIFTIVASTACCLVLQIGSQSMRKKTTEYPNWASKHASDARNSFREPAMNTDCVL